MIDKLQKAEENYIRIEENLSDPYIISNQEEYTRLMKEYKNLTPIIEAFRRYKATDKAMKDAQELMGHSDIALTRDVYTHIRAARKQETAKKIDRFLAKKKKKPDNKIDNK